MGKFFKQIVNKPANVSDADIESWVQEFYAFVNTNNIAIRSRDTMVDVTDLTAKLFAIDTTENQNADSSVCNLTLEFSDAVIKSPYRFMTRMELIRFIRQEYTVSDTARNAIMTAETDNQLREAVNAVAETNANTRDEYIEIAGELLPLLDRVSDEGTIHYDQYITGEYIEKEQKIVLYSKAIKKAKLPNQSLSHGYISAFVHEAFHAVHYACGEAIFSVELKAETAYPATVVKETLATAFEIAFCKLHNTPTPMIQNVETSSPVSYPYAPARYFFSNDVTTGVFNGRMFNHFFAQSLGDINNALTDLMLYKEPALIDPIFTRVVNIPPKPHSPTQCNNRSSYLFLNWKKGDCIDENEDYYVIKYTIINKSILIYLRRGGIIHKYTSILTKKEYERLYTILNNNRNSINKSRNVMVNHNPWDDDNGTDSWDVAIADKKHFCISDKLFSDKNLNLALADLMFDIQARVTE